jgi:eukaryotic-like serine/threonine-protein kinase
VAPDPFIDHVFDGRYRIIKKLGTGGMANVYLAEDLELGRNVALKMLDERHAQDEQFVERFRREAKNAASLTHPNVVVIYARGEAEGTYYIAMEYLEGRTLKQLLVTHGPPPIPVALEYTRQVLAALGFAHRNGIVHRDIKPHNIVVGPDGRLKVTDFGIARSGASQMTEAGSIIGTAQYLSPEQARGTTVDQRSDLYSVGVVLYEMLTGTVPFTGDTPLEIAMKHLSATPEPPSNTRPDVPHNLDKVVLRALAKHPDDRYQSAHEMDADLASVGDGTVVALEPAEATVLLPPPAAPAGGSTAAPPPQRPKAGSPDDLERRRRRRRIWLRLLAVTALLLVAGLAWYLYPSRHHRSSSPKSGANVVQEPPLAGVPSVVGMKEVLAVEKIRNAGLKPHVRRLVDDQTPVGQVFGEDPAAGTKTRTGNVVTITVSQARPRVRVPKVIGKPAYDATAALVVAHLKYKVFQVHSDKPVGVVTGQAPRARARIVEGAVVRLDVSQGPEKIALPRVIGAPFAQASAQLQAAGFAVARIDVDSNDPKDTVLAESPAAATLQLKTSTITLTVSKGPQTHAVPDVTGAGELTAISKLAAGGFITDIRLVNTPKRASDGIVLNQSPRTGTQAKQGTKVRIVVGHYVPPVTPPTATTPTPSPPPTATTPTTPPTTTPPPSGTAPTTTVP